jgi:hypothetical protein
MTLMAGPSYRNHRAPASSYPGFPAPTGRTGCVPLRGAASPPATHSARLRDRRPPAGRIRCRHLEGLLAGLRARGAGVLDRREDSADGKFGYVVDPDGTLLELWQPPG